MTRKAEVFARELIQKAHSLLECGKIGQATIDRVEASPLFGQEMESVSLSLSPEVSMTITIYTKAKT